MKRAVRFQMPVIYLIILFVAFVYVGCGHGQYEYQWSFLTNTDNSKEKLQDIDLINKTKTATDALLKSCNEFLDKEQSIIVTSLVNIDNIQKSSRYGRMSSEIIASRMAQKSYNVKEVKLTQSDIFVRQHEGEFALSRKLKEIAHKHKIRALVVGTYALGGQNVNISLRVVRTKDNRIICAHCYAVEHNNHLDLW